VRRNLALLAAAIALIVAAIPVQASAAGFRPIAAGKFTLARSGIDAGAYARVRALERNYPHVGVGRVIADANRETRPLTGSPAVSGIANLAGGFRWNSGDDDVSYWYPQGITGSADAEPGGSVAGHRILLASWYSNNGKGVRVSFVNADKLDGARYRHVLLVRPNAHGGFSLVKVHAGGIAWFGHLLYVADTDNGLRVFDTNRLVRAHGKQSLGYKYLLPQVGAYKSTGRKLRWSFISIDRSRSPASLLAGEYVDGKAGGRVVRWPLRSASGLIARRKASAAYVSPERNMQGALSLGGRLFASASRGSSPGVLTSGKPRRRTRSVRWGIGPEDLTYSPVTKRLYTLTEHRGLRTVFAIQR
jgi:hypothetical protein